MGYVFGKVWIHRIPYYIGTDLPIVIVRANLSVIHRDTELFGQEAEDFKPDRWLTTETGKMHIALPPCLSVNR